MRDDKTGPQATPLPPTATTRPHGKRFRLSASCRLGLIATTCLLLAACVGGGTKQGQQPRAIAYNDTATHGKTMEQLLPEFIDKIVAVASGEKSRNEINDYREISIFKNGVTL